MCKIHDYEFDSSLYRKMDDEEVQGLMHMRRRAYALKNKKGKGSYNRYDNSEENEYYKESYDD